MKDQIYVDPHDEIGWLKNECDRLEKKNAEMKSAFEKLSKKPKTKPKQYAHFLTTTDYFKLDVACIPVNRAFRMSLYMVGSVLTKPDWRDVDLRAVLDDSEFDRLFPVVDSYQENAQWKIICISISAYLSNVTGLPIDFQIQRRTQANAKYSGPRNGIGLFVHEYDRLPRGE